MEIFYSDNILRDVAVLTAEDSLHCVRVLRHREGDDINVVDGEGTMYECRIENDNPKMVQARIVAAHRNWNAHPYHLTMAVCPTKNNDRFEWFVEKAVELGVDRICPVVGDRSERRVYKAERARKIAIAATKQSLKAAIPAVDEAADVSDFIRNDDARYRFIACCYEDENHPRVLLGDAVAAISDADPSISVLIGPEGDFSPAELESALASSYVPVSLGASRLRTETAGVISVATIYNRFQK